MATLTAWKFATPHGAENALIRLERLHDQMLINLRDAAVVSWEPGHKKPKTHELHDTTKAGAMSGGFWGFADTDAELIRTNLSDEQEAKLREAFGLEA
jgi:uncharacterized membrane protein